MKIYVHGNCQSSVIRRLLMDGCSSVSVKSREVHVIDVTGDRASFAADIAEADVILTQPIAENYRGVDFLSTSWIRAHAKANATVLLYPSLFFRGHHPQTFYLRLVPNVHRMPYHDAHILALYAEGYSAADITCAIRSDTYLAPEFVKSEAERSLHDLASREVAAGIDLPVSQIVMADLTEDRLFHTINHPKPHLFMALCGCVADRLGLDWHLESPTRDYLSTPSLPLYPSVKSAFGIGGPDGCYRLHQGVLSLQEYVAWVTSTYEQVGVDSLQREMAANPELRAYLDRFAAWTT